MYLIDTCVSAQNIGNKDRFRHHEEAIKSNNNQFSSVTNHVRLFCNLMDCSTPDLLVHHQPGVYWNWCPLNQWCHPTISSSVATSSSPQTFPASGSFPVSQLLASGGQSIGTSAQQLSFQWIFMVWFLLEWTGLISLLSKGLLKGLSRIFSSTTVGKYQFVSAQPSLWYNSHIHTWLLEKP